MNLLIKLTINFLTLLVVEYLVPGFKFDSVSALLATTIVIGIVNMLIKPIVQIIALPISILTLGVFAFLVNVALLWGVAAVVPGFQIQSFTTAIIASIVMALVSWFLHKLARE